MKCVLYKEIDRMRKKGIFQLLNLVHKKRKSIIRPGRNGTRWDRWLVSNNEEIDKM